MRGFIGYFSLFVSVVALFGVGERLFAALYMTWKFGFENTEPVHLVSQSFWLFVVVFAGVMICTALLLSLFVERLGFSPTQSKYLQVSLFLQCCTGCLLVVMLSTGLAVLT